MAISVGNVFMAAVVPGLTLATFYLIYVATLASIRPNLAPPLPGHLLNIPKGQMAPLVLRSFLPPVFLISLIKGSILFGFATPSEAGAVGAFGATLLAAANGRLSRSTLVSVCHSAARTVSMIFFIVVSATCFAYVYRSLGGDDVIETLIIEKAGLGPWGMLILVMVIVFFLGFFLDFLEITLIVLPVFTPLIIQMDFGDHVAHADIKFWFIILLAVNLQTSFLTPPFGFALFYMKGIAPKEIRIQSIYIGIIPFVILQALGVITVMAFPDVALWLMHAAYD
jgi:tripartite ATP-independent transporter DctM subunit